MISVDESLAKFKEFKQEFEILKITSITETDTRSKILDRLLIDILGWKEQNIDREGYVKDIGYYDYQIKCLSKDFTFVVEAKKTFVEFSLPTRNKQVAIETLITNYNNKEIIDQIRSYIKDRDLEYGIISNGHQFIIGKFYGSNFKKNKCLIFNGFDDIEDRFIEFYNALSYKCITANNGFFIQEERNFEPKTIFSSITEKHQEVVIRNTLRPELQQIVDKVFDEIHKYEDLNDKEIILECFVKNEETKANQNAIERLFADHTPKLNEVVSPKTDSAFSQIENNIIKYPKTLKNTPPKPIILIGTKGAGKTTFINYFFKIYLNDTLKGKNPFIYLDFKKYLDLDFVQGVHKIYKDLLDELLETFEFLTEPKTLERVYLREIKNLKKIWELQSDNYDKQFSDFLTRKIDDTENHFVKLSEYLINERQTRLCIIIDNADQLDEKYQKEAYLLAQNFNLKALCATIISLREGYYYKYRNDLPFNAFGADKTFHITAPPYKEILQKRINYTLNKLVNLESKQGNVSDKIFSISPDKIKTFFQNLDKTLFGNNSEMLKYLEQTSQNNIREGLRNFRYFLESAHTQLEDYVLRTAIPENSKYAPIPIYEFIKSLGLDNKLYYNHQISRIYNIFYPEAGNKSHFTKFRILKYLFEQTKKGGYNEKFVQLSNVLDFFEKFGYDKEALKKEMNKLLSYRLIETQNFITDIEKSNIFIDEKSDLCISYSGHYYITELICRFHYLDLILQDTPIYNKEYFEDIKLNFPYYYNNVKRNLSKRKKVVEIFIEYLQFQEKSELSNSLNLLQEEQVIFKESIVSYMLSEGLQQDIYNLDNAINK